MKSWIAIASLFLSSSAFAGNLCATYAGQERYMNAIGKVAQELNVSTDQLCANPKYWAIEAQPARKYNREGEVIPYVRVQLHMEYDSCLFMVRDQDLAITEQRCYSGF